MGLLVTVTAGVFVFGFIMVFAHFADKKNKK